MTTAYTSTDLVLLFRLSDSGIERVDTGAARPKPQVRGAPVGPLCYLFPVRTSVSVRHPVQRAHLQEQTQDGLLSHHHGQSVSLSIVAVTGVE